jgi:hypothetical protein
MEQIHKRFSSEEVFHLRKKELAMLNSVSGSITIKSLSPKSLSARK